MSQRTLCLRSGGIRARSRWSVPDRNAMRIHDMIVFTNAEYRVPVGKEPYRENTRETFRRQAIHQFEQARVVDRNPGLGRPRDEQPTNAVRAFKQRI